MIPADPKIPGHEAFRNTDVPCVCQLPPPNTLGGPGDVVDAVSAHAPRIRNSATAICLQFIRVLAKTGR